MSLTAPGMATIKYHDGGKSALILLDGIVTPSVLQLWRKKTEIFFDVKKLEVSDHVKSILACFSSQSFVNWINENEDTLRNLPWADFMTQLKKTALTPGWDVTIFRTMINIKQPTSQSFAKWMNEVRGANFSLSDTCFHKNTAALRAHIESHISNDLADYLASLTKNEHDRTEALEDLEEWLHKIIDLDEKMASSQKHHLALVKDAVKQQRTLYSSYRSLPSRPAASSSNAIAPVPSIPSHVLASGAPKVTTLLRSKVDIPPGYRFPPKLTEQERELIRIHKGCRVCCQLFADHSLPCNRLPPDATIYHTITPDFITEAKRTAPIAAVHDDPDSPAPSEENIGFFPVAAVIPSDAVPFTLGNGSVSSDEVGPLSVKHFLWSAKAWALDGIFLSLNCLIDTGAHLNCIRSDLVRKLNLKSKTLAKPLLVTLAFDGSSAKRPHLFSFYVEFSLLSKNSDWESRTCKALVVNNLCTDFILGLPFLCHNKLVVNCEAETIIHKPLGFNLLSSRSLPHV